MLDGGRVATTAFLMLRRLRPGMAGWRPFILFRGASGKFGRTESETRKKGAANPHARRRRHGSPGLRLLQRVFSDYFVQIIRGCHRDFVRMKTIITAIQIVLVASAAAAAADRTAGNDTAVDAVQALKRLEDGNARFVAGKPQHPHETLDWRRTLEGAQHPFAVVLGCSDSRVAPELVFDQGFGDLFVVRVAGNVVETDVAASIEYAIDHLDTQLIVVMGHSLCGAVTATVDHLSNPDGEPAEVVSLLYRIEPAILGIPADVPRQERIERAVQRNVERAVRRLSRVPDLRRSINAGKIKILGAVYDMHTGKVAFLESPDGRMP